MLSGGQLSVAVMLVVRFSVQCMLGRVHLVVVVRLWTHLLLPVEWPHRPKARTVVWRRRLAEEARQITLAVKLILPGPDPDRENLGHAASAAKPLLGGNLDLKRYLQPIVHFKEQAKRRKLSPERQAGSILETSQNP